jgi:hypothetical protein
VELGRNDTVKVKVADATCLQYVKTYTPLFDCRSLSLSLSLSLHLFEVVGGTLWYAQVCGGMLRYASRISHSLETDFLSEKRILILFLAHSLVGSLYVAPPLSLLPSLSLLSSLPALALCVHVLRVWMCCVCVCGCRAKCMSLLSHDCLFMLSQDCDNLCYGVHSETCASKVRHPLSSTPPTPLLSPTTTPLLSSPPHPLLSSPRRLASLCLGILSLLLPVAVAGAVCVGVGGGVGVASSRVL